MNTEQASKIAKVYVECSLRSRRLARREGSKMQEQRRVAYGIARHSATLLDFVRRGEPVDARTIEDAHQFACWATCRDPVWWPLACAFGEVTR